MHTQKLVCCINYQYTVCLCTRLLLAMYFWCCFIPICCCLVKYKYYLKYPRKYNNLRFRVFCPKQGWFAFESSPFPFDDSLDSSLFSSEAEAHCVLNAQFIHAEHVGDSLKAQSEHQLFEVVCVERIRVLDDFPIIERKHEVAD